MLIVHQWTHDAPMTYMKILPIFVAKWLHTQLETTFLEAVAIIIIIIIVVVIVTHGLGLCEREGFSFRALPCLICCLMLSGQVWYETGTLINQYYW